MLRERTLRITDTYLRFICFACAGRRTDGRERIEKVVCLIGIFYYKNTTNTEGRRAAAFHTLQRAHGQRPVSPQRRL